MSQREAGARSVGERPAGPADSQSCADLCEEALDGLAGRRGGSLFARRESGLLAEALLSPQGLARLLEDTGRRVVLGTIEDDVVGLAVGRIEPVGEEALGVFEALYVTESRRGMGVGKLLVESLVRWFATSGCTSVDASALPGDRETKNFFEGAGFKARLLTMHRQLD